MSSAIYQVLALDSDKGENGRVWYYLQPSGNRDWEYFRLDRLTGELTVEKRMDRETHPQVFEIQVKAEDNGQPHQSQTITLHIQLTDIDDNPPSFSNVPQPQNLIVEEEREGAEVGQVLTPTDVDTGPNNNIICYFLYSGENVTKFQIDKHTGVLSLVGKLDREETEYLDIVIRASSDCRDSTSAMSNTVISSDDPSLLKVRVTVTDINDNPPQFKDEGDFLSAGIISDVDIGTQVISLKGSTTDRDTLPNTAHQFRLISVTPHLEKPPSFPASPFAINKNNTIATNVRFSSDMEGHFELEVMAIDKDGLNDTTQIRVSHTTSSQ